MSRRTVSTREIFLSFLRLGLTSFGGVAMVAYIRELAVEKKGWLSERSFDDGAALCQTIPGAIAMQAAGYVGLRVRGIRGGLAAYTGFALPAFVLMLLFSALYRTGREIPAVTAAFGGLQGLVVAIVAHAALSFGRLHIRTPADAALAVAASAYLANGGNPIVAVLTAGVLGIVLYRNLGAAGKHRNAGGRKAAGGTLRNVALMTAGFVAVVFLLKVFDGPYHDLSALMARIDIFAFGGAYASIPLLLHEVVEVRGWIDERTFMDAIALGQITPGPVVITATCIGYLTAGFGGALAATLGMFTPSFLVLAGTVPFLDRLRGSPLTGRVLRGILASFVGLLAAVTFRFFLATPWSATTSLIGLAALGALLRKVDILWVVLLSVAVSLAGAFVYAA